MISTYFIRHGESELNASNKFGTPEAPLTNHGRDQARTAGKNLKDRLHFDLIISSTLPRAVETADIIAKEVGYPVEGIERDERIVEIKDGGLAGQDYTPENVALRNQYFLTEHNEMGVETKNEMLARLEPFCADLKRRPEGIILVVGHGFSGRMLRRILGNLDLTRPLPKLDNAELIQLFPYSDTLPSSLQETIL